MSVAYELCAPYDDCLARYEQERGSDWLYAQPQAVSDRASSIIINSVTRFPQTAGGAIIAADRILDQFNVAGPSQTRIGIREMAQLIPDPAFCADNINRIHRRFGIPAVVAPPRAAETVCRFAVNALDRIQRDAMSVAREMRGIPLPASEDMNVYIPRPDMGIGLYGPWSSNRYVAFSLHEFLGAYPEVRDTVAVRIKTEANALRHVSRLQQASEAQKFQSHD